MTYAGVSRGYRSGGFNTSFLDVSDLAFDPEYSWNYEVGFKSSWFNNRVNFNTSLFYIDLSDQQVRQANTGTQVFLVLDVKPIDAMEDVRVVIRV